MIQWLAAISMCLLLAGCGEDGETTESTGVATPGGAGGSPARAGRLQFSASSATVSESAGTVTVTVTRTEGSDGAASVRVASRDGTATQPQDYTAVSTTVTFAAGDAAAKTVTVPIVNDTTSEPGETLYLALSSATGGASLGSVSELLVTITDDDVAAPAAPRAVMSAAYKQLRIDWTSVTGATSYRLLKDPTGSSGFAQVGTDLPAAAKSVNLDVIVHKEDWLNARYVVAACNAGGCTQSAAVSAAGNSTPLIGYLKASNTAEFDGLGGAVALSADGNTLAVGAPSEDGASTGVGGDQTNDCDIFPNTRCAFGSGAVYVYRRSGTTWSAPIYVKASNTAMSDSFGTTLSLSADGNTLAVGATGKDLASGAVYIFARANDTWSQIAYIKASDAANSTYFGSSLALSADGARLVVGAPLRTPPSTTLYNAGAAYVFVRSGAAWSETAILTQQTISAYSYFGTSVAIANDSAPMIAIGAPGEDVATGNPPPNDIADYAGAVYVYTLAGSVWTQSSHLVSAIPLDSASFGDAVALSADGATLAVGASGEDLAPATPSDPATPGAGAAYMYTASGSSWTEVAHLRALNPTTYSYFGGILALSADGNTLAVASPQEDGGALGVGGTPDTAAPSAGAAYVFTRTGSTWSPGTYVKASNTEMGDGFGASIALSADGNTMAVGAQSDDSPATNFNGSQLDDCDSSGNGSNCAAGSGAVYVY